MEAISQNDANVPAGLPVDGIAMGFRPGSTRHNSYATLWDLRRGPPPLQPVTHGRPAVVPGLHPCYPPCKPGAAAHATLPFFPPVAAATWCWSLPAQPIAAAVCRACTRIHTEALRTDPLVQGAAAVAVRDG
eukprot:1161280-Pelagomonas_calceolata.AAC.2